MDSEMKISLELLSRIDKSVLNFSNKQKEDDIKINARAYYKKISKDIKILKKWIMALDIETERLILKKLQIKRANEERLKRQLAKGAY
jgi:hypothetical protein